MYAHVQSGGALGLRMNVCCSYTQMLLPCLRMSTHEVASILRFRLSHRHEAEVVQLRTCDPMEWLSELYTRQEFIRLSIISLKSMIESQTVKM